MAAKCPDGTSRDTTFLPRLVLHKRGPGLSQEL